MELLPLAWGIDAVRYGGVLVLKGRVIPSLSHQASLLIDNKLATKALLAEAGLPTPAGAPLTGLLDVDLPVLQALLAQGPIVVKPVAGTHGRGVLLDPPSAEAAARHAAHLAEPALAEALVAGADLRLHALGGRVVAACVRTPPSVTGDGHTSIAALIEALDAEVRRPNPQNRAVLDAHVIDVLAEQR
ncbi:MAG: hypothetical protein KC549_09690, partial [Myxococcales bacterium]|nr:hypothetical protein [Myxococcales bacterium]